ncbi:small basic family protein [Eubacterium barkeri]|uniref:Small basic protein n=1 Tax=Eubacterium barkeri TaxID=1528 RepID=A0A1H3EFP8_EUBBA|nr:Small basic protein [Eubacterium barkeri]
MLFPLIGLMIGLIIGLFLPIEVPLAYSSYLSIAILAALNSIFGGIQADLEGAFDQKLFITGFFGNTVLAALLTYIGDRIGVPIYYAAIFYFGTTLFSNFAKIRRHYFHTEGGNKNSVIKREEVPGTIKESAMAREKKDEGTKHPVNMEQLRDVEGDD